MKAETVERIMKKVTDTWEEKIPIGTTLYQEQIDTLRNILKLCPDDDGLKRVTHLETNKTYLVPYEVIILKGISGKDLEKYPEELK